MTARHLVRRPQEHPQARPSLARQRGQGQQARSLAAPNHLARQRLLALERNLSSKLRVQRLSVGVSSSQRRRPLDSLQVAQHRPHLERLCSEAQRSSNLRERQGHLFLVVPLNSSPREPPGHLRLVLLHSNSLRARQGRRYLVARHNLVHLLSRQLDYSVHRHSSSSSRPSRAPVFLGAPYSRSLRSQLWVPLLVQQDHHSWVYNSRGLFSLARLFIY